MRATVGLKADAVRMRLHLVLLRSEMYASVGNRVDRKSTENPMRESARIPMT